MPTETNMDMSEQLKQRFLQLPKVVQDAITSADVQEHLRELANTHKLHLDQWDKLENEVMLALLGFQPTEELGQNIKSQLNVSDEVALALANDIATTVFEPIREELERQLEHPDAKAEAVSDVDAVRAQVLEDKTPAQAAATPAPAVSAAIGATPPPEPPAEKAVRAPISENYKAGEASTERKAVHDDPYREPPV